jgi:hypothetical protein
MTAPEKILSLYIQAKERADQAAKDLAIARRALLSCLYPQPLEGTCRQEIGGITIKTVNALDRLIDAQELEKLLPQISPDDDALLFRRKVELNIKHYKTLEQANPKLYALVNTCITTKPKSITIEIEAKTGT